MKFSLILLLIQISFNNLALADQETKGTFLKTTSNSNAWFVKLFQYRFKHYNGGI